MSAPRNRQAVEEPQEETPREDSKAVHVNDKETYGDDDDDIWWFESFDSEEEGSPMRSPTVSAWSTDLHLVELLTRLVEKRRSEFPWWDYNVHELELILRALVVVVEFIQLVCALV
ncbi:hypothetical protein FOZ60_016900 [Perkinsus olseni]|uniref:Uncharacterized protein n=1 Tax=Perkinsus olseni TaxID=32597 RepID=A0A7J6N2N0_PEROL|nr:hypothetical protein FOZ60_016900 [Perkinsus olseni]